MLTALVTYSLAATLIVLLPGPDTLVVVRSLLRRGKRAAVLTVAGVLTGLTAWVCAASLGLSAVLRASHAGYTALRIVGAAYLVWIGVQSLRSRGMVSEEAVAVDGGPTRGGLLGSGYLAGLATDLLNPKVGVFFVTFLPGFVPHGRPIGTTCLIFGAIFVVETAAYFAILLSLAGRVTRWMADAKIRRRLERTTGVVLIGFGARLAIES
jgi:threonine/homoserine/homoserine lactone efflux protein